MINKPDWFTDGKVLVSFAPTCGINKDGEELYRIESSTGNRTTDLDDQVRTDIEAVLDGQQTDTIRWIDSESVAESRIIVPVYYDNRLVKQLEDDLLPTLGDFTSASLGELHASRVLSLRTGHGSPSSDVRRGEIPYIKVSDLRAGQVNINPTNRVSRVIAERFWRGHDSGLNAFDLITPLRASKNIGEFCVLMPGQEEIVLTREVLVMRPGPAADFDSMYLAWAMSLKVVRQQWSRIVFMQTNREDAGTRYRDIVIPVPPSRAAADRVSSAFRRYYEGISSLRDDFVTYLNTDDRHHVFLAARSLQEDEDDAGTLGSEEQE